LQTDSVKIPIRGGTSRMLIEEVVVLPLPTSVKDIRTAILLFEHKSLNKGTSSSMFGNERVMVPTHLLSLHIHSLKKYVIISTLRTYSITILVLKQKGQLRLGEMSI